MIVCAACDSSEATIPYATPLSAINAEARGYYRSGTLVRHIWVEDFRDAENMAASRSMLLDGEALRLSASLGSMVGTGAARGNLWAAGFG